MVSLWPRLARRRLRVMRRLGVATIVAGITLVTLVTAFDVDTREPFSDDEAAPSSEVQDQLSSTEQATTDQTTAEQTTAEQATAGQATAGQTSAEQATAGQATAGQTTAGQTTAERSPEKLNAEPVGSFAGPVDVITRADDDRLFVVELLGTIVAVDFSTADPADSDDPTGSTTSTMLDITELTLVEGERGLLGAAFHPTEDLLYVHYSDLHGDSVIAEYEVDPETAIADSASRREVLTVAQPYSNHNGGQLTFGPDGFLYLGFGDGGSAGDPDRVALDLSSRLGKILRIDPVESDSAPFTVPDDNPFVEVDDADPTIWSYGLRNPWKFSFDAETAGLWIADVGQNQWEEINFAAADAGAGAGAGVSFGWSAFEGDDRYNQDQSADGHTDPYLSYERLEGKCSISGGAVYRGDAVPALDGWYVYGDYCTGQIFAFDTSVDADDIEVLELAQLDDLVAISAGPDGELYALSVAGPIVRLT